VPPKTLFAVTDRNFPLKVGAHLHCNRRQSGDDEVIGQLIAVIHGTHPKLQKGKLKTEIFKIPESSSIR
jgi:hypothetical protein